MNRRKGIVIVLTRRIEPTFPQMCLAQNERMLLTRRNGKFDDLSRSEFLLVNSFNIILAKVDPCLSEFDMAPLSLDA